MNIDLSRIHYDADAILEQLQQYVESDPNGVTFKDFYVGATGLTLLQTQSGVGALNNYAAESALQEATLLFAKNESSIYAYTAGQGVRIGRRSPARCTAVLTREDTDSTQTIAEFSQFNVGGVPLFNRDSIIFDIGESEAEVTLYEGTVVSRTVFGLGEDYQVWVSPEDAFQISDTDVRLRKNNVPVEVTSKGLWNYRGVEAAQDWTSAKGHLILKFGNDEFGLKPGLNDELTILYALTSGSSGNNANFSGTTFTFAGVIQGTVTSALQAGDNQKPAALYKSTTPNLWGSHEAAVTRDQYHAEATQYPGVRDIKFYAQRELSTEDLRYMNLYKVVVLTETPWSDSDKDTFAAWMQRRSMYSGRFFFEDPRPQEFDIEVDLYIRNTLNPVTAKSMAEAAITRLFELRHGFLQSHIYRSDIELACYNIDQAVKFVRVRAPDSDLFVGVEPPTVTATALAGSGTLPAGTYNYAVTALNSVGETRITSYPQVILDSVGRVRLDWDAVPNATGYKVYGRTAASIQLIATLGAATLTYTDNGSVVPNGQQPLVDTSGVWYGVANSITVNVYFSDRIAFNNR